MAAANVTETKEAVAGAIAIIKAARLAGNNGWQTTDAGLLINDPKLREAVTAAIEGADRIVIELSKLSIFDTMDLATYVLKALPEALGAK